jgi:cytochrome c peroxidase
MRFPLLPRLRIVMLAAQLGLASAAWCATPAELLAGYQAQAGKPASAERGKAFFGKNFGQQMGWSCSSCHTEDPTRQGKDDVSEKPIDPMAPAFNPKRFTDKTKVENAFRLNCKDVVGRECTALEKADLLSWLLTLKP